MKPRVLEYLDAEALEEMHNALDLLEKHAGKLYPLDARERQSIAKMGDMSVPFVREAMDVMEQNPGILPANFNLAHAVAGLRQLDAFDVLMVRIVRFHERVRDMRTALRSDAMRAALFGFDAIKRNGQDEGLNAAAQSLSERFRRLRATVHQTRSSGTSNLGSE